jgi:hypothetical protein
VRATKHMQTNNYKKNYVMQIQLKKLKGRVKEPYMESMLTTLIKSAQEQLKVINIEKKKTQLTSSKDI